MRLLPLYSSTGLNICPTSPFKLRNNRGMKYARPQRWITMIVLQMKVWSNGVWLEIRGRQVLFSKCGVGNSEIKTLNPPYTSLCLKKQIDFLYSISEEHGLKSLACVAAQWCAAEKDKQHQPCEWCLTSPPLATASTSTSRAPRMNLVMTTGCSCRKHGRAGVSINKSTVNSPRANRTAAF